MAHLIKPKVAFKEDWFSPIKCHNWIKMSMEAMKKLKFECFWISTTSSSLQGTIDYEVTHKELVVYPQKKNSVPTTDFMFTRNLALGLCYFFLNQPEPQPPSSNQSCQKSAKYEGQITVFHFL